MRWFLVLNCLHCLPLLAAGEGKALLRFEKGEIIPGIALALDKTGTHAYTLRLPPRFAGAQGEALRKRLEKALEGLAGVQIKWQGSDLLIKYQGPDTPLLQTLATIKLEPTG